MNKLVKPKLGAALRALRQQHGWTLTDMSRQTGFSVSTLSKVEHGRISLSYDKLTQLSERAGVDIAELFSPSVTTQPGAMNGGRRSITRAGEGELVPTRNYDYWYLNTDVLQKKFVPMIGSLHARTMDEFGDLVTHSGEEFIFVIEGEVEVHTSTYAPFTLKAGDSAYIDSHMGHAYLRKSEKPCRLLAICSASESQLAEAHSHANRAKPRATEAPTPRKRRRSTSKSRQRR